MAQTQSLTKARDIRIVKHHERQAWAVEFICDNGRRHRSTFTSHRLEAEGWAKAVGIYGWSDSGRPLPSSTPFEDEDYVIASRKAAA